MIPSTVLRTALLVALPATLTAQSLPMKRVATPTTAAINATDLMSRLYAYADDSMGGRAGGTIYNTKATDFIAAELKRLGLKPGGTDGYFQPIPLVRRGPDASSSLSVDGQAFALNTDFLLGGPRGSVPRLTVTGGDVIVGGDALDSTTWISAAQGAGKIVVFKPTAALATAGTRPFAVPSGTRFKGAAAVVFPILDAVPAPMRGQLGGSAVGLAADPTKGVAPILYVSAKMASAMLGADIMTAAPGTAGKKVTGRAAFSEEPLPARNVIGIIPGSDPKLRGSYVAIGAHNDHVPFRTQPVDHDSLRAYNTARLLMTQALPAGQSLSREQLASIKVNVDSLRRIRPARLDSINNGADDDGSGTVTVLEIAQAIQAMKVKPKRSIIFVWHTGEELGLLGARHFTEYPTVPRDSIIAQLNMDMVGRGAVGDLKGGGPDYLQLVGSRRLSTELGDLVEAMNKLRKAPFTFDYQFDADGHPDNIYCRSDHYHYARWGIPVVFFTTGLHQDYHQITDEPQYIDYPHMAEVGNFVRDIAVKVANNPKRPVVDKAKPDPYGVCRQ